MKTTFFALFLSLSILSNSIGAQALQAIDTDGSLFRSTSEIPAGTIISVRIESEISSRNSAVNDTFTAVLTEPLVVNGIEVLPAKTLVNGRIVEVQRSARGGKNGKLGFSFERITLVDGTNRGFKGELVNSIGKPDQIVGNSSPAVNVALVGGGIGIGTAIGAAAGGKSKSTIGGILGAGIGIGSIFFRKGSEATLNANSKLSIKVKETVVLPVKDY